MFKNIFRLLNMVNYFKGHYYAIHKIGINYFKKFILHQNVLRYIEIALNYNCNANCYFCSCSKDKFKPQNKELLTLKDIEKIIKESKKYNPLMMGIAGGEPFLSPLLYDTIKIIRKNKILPAIISNGILANQERLLKLKEAGLCWYCVSIHAIGKKHDEIVGVKGAFDNAVKSLMIAREIGLVPQIGLTPTNETIENGEFDKVINFAVTKKIFITLDYPVPSGVSQGDMSLLLNNKNLKYVQKVCMNNSYVSVDLQNNYSGYSCPAGDVCCYITAYGDVTPCPFIQISYGNIKKESFENIYERMSSAPWFKDKHPYCLGGECKKFIKECLIPIGDNPPMNVLEHPKKGKGL